MSRSSAIDHLAQEPLGALAFGRRQIGERAAMRFTCGSRRRMARPRPASVGIEQALAAVDRAGALVDEAGVDELLEDAAEALLGDPQDIEQVGDADARDGG